MKIGLYGGTFNPPHMGHIRMARAFYAAVQPDKMLIVPNKRPVHKICADLATDEERLALCRLAFPESEYTVSDMEISRRRDSFTWFTVQTLLEQYPDAELSMLVGSDMFLSFHKWYHYQDILEHVKLYVAARQAADSLQVLREYAFSRLRLYLRGDESEKVVFLPIEPLEISSSELRERLQAGEDTGSALAPAVLDFIKEHGMYGYRKKR